MFASLHLNGEDDLFFTVGANDGLALALPLDHPPLICYRRSNPNTSGYNTFPTRLVVSCFLPLHSNEHVDIQTHLNVLLRVLQIIEKCIFSPENSTLLIRTRVRISVSLSRLTSKKSVQVGSLLVSPAFFDSVAL